MGWEDVLLFVLLDVGSWICCLSGRCILALTPSWSRKACEMLWLSWVWILLCSRGDIESGLCMWLVLGGVVACMWDVGAR